MLTTLLKQRTPIAMMVTGLGLMSGSPGLAKTRNEITFKMVTSAAAHNCLPRAKAQVEITPLGPVENMHVEVRGLPPKTQFDFFVIQVPQAPFGLSWYQGDIETDEYGRGEQNFVGRFNRETFIVAPGSAPAPFVHNNAFPDAILNPATGPIHTFHLGLWFNSPRDAAQAGCPNTVTPFNGEHNAGIQVMNTSNFPNDRGPLFQVEP